jgi:hypothetical protein
VNQSTVLIGGVLAMWVLYLAANNRFGAYLQTVWPRPVAAQAGAFATGGATSPGGALGAAASSALGAAFGTPSSTPILSFPGMVGTVLGSLIP